MKSFIYILLTSLTFLVVGCQNESEEIRLINQAAVSYTHLTSRGLGDVYKRQLHWIPFRSRKR